jgi:hypothetical protein
MSVETRTHAESADADTAHAQADAQVGSVLAAGVGLFGALRRTLIALAALLLAEARLLRASLAMALLYAVALVAFAVSLWACVVALIGWALTVATHSLGIALTVLVALHLLLVVALWFALKRMLQRASFAGTRAEMRSLGRELLRDMQRFQDTQAAEQPAPSSTPEAES